MAARVPEVIRVSDDYRARLAAGEAQAVATMADAYAKTYRALAEQAKLLAEEIARMRAAGEAVPPWRIAELERYRTLMEQTVAELAKLGRLDQQIIEDLQRQGIELGLGMAEAQVEALIPASVRVLFNKMPVQAMEQLVGFLADGSPLAQLLAALGDETARAIADLLLKGLGLGWNPRKVARELQREIGMALTRALRIARTEMLRAWRTSSIKSYRDQGSLIKGYRRHAQKDDRTCIACLLEDGTFYETADMFTDHVQGRCCVIPVTRSWAELGFPGVEDTNVEWDLGRKWFEAQNAATQRKIVGDGLYEAWKAGEIGLDDMKTLHKSAEWGDSWQQSTVTGAHAKARSREGFTVE